MCKTANEDWVRIEFWQTQLGLESDELLVFSRLYSFCKYRGYYLPDIDMPHLLDWLAATSIKYILEILAKLERKGLIIFKKQLLANETMYYCELTGVAYESR